MGKEPNWAENALFGPLPFLFLACARGPTRAASLSTWACLVIHSQEQRFAIRFHAPTTGSYVAVTPAPLRTLTGGPLYCASSPARKHRRDFPGIDQLAPTFRSSRPPLMPYLAPP
jgi:hypothetical protein